MSSFPGRCPSTKVARSRSHRTLHYLLLRMGSPMLALLICPSGAHAGDDVHNAQIIAEIQDHLDRANVSKHGQVQVSVADGVATLSGKVDSLGVKTDAHNAAMKDADLVRIVDNIQVDTAGGTPNQIVEQARRRLRNCYAYSVYDYVEFEAHGNTLIASGEVTQPYKKESINYSVAHIKGVAAIDNKIQVLPLSSFDDDLRTGVARAIYDDPQFSEYVDAGRLPIHIIAKDGHVTLEGVVDSKADRAKAEEDAGTASAPDLVTNNLRVAGLGH
jgi:hyperosmotically inducible periplasmic protein